MWNWLPPATDCILAHRNALKLNILGDEGIAVAYALIPLSIAFLVLRMWPAIRHEWATWYYANMIYADRVYSIGKRLPIEFIAFILLCGATHHLANVTLWHHNYAMLGIVKLITAAVSLWTFIDVALIAYLFGEAYQYRLAARSHDSGNNR